MIKCAKCGAETAPNSNGKSACCEAPMIADMSAKMQGVGGMKR